MLQTAQGFVTVGGGYDGVAGAGQGGTAEFQGDGFIVHNEDRRCRRPISGTPIHNRDDNKTARIVISLHAWMQEGLDSGEELGGGEGFLQERTPPNQGLFFLRELIRPPGNVEYFCVG